METKQQIILTYANDFVDATKRLEHEISEALMRAVGALRAGRYNALQTLDDEKSFYGAPFFPGYLAALFKKGNCVSLLWVGEEANAIEWTKNHQIWFNAERKEISVVVTPEKSLETLRGAQKPCKNAQAPALFAKVKDDELLKLGVGRERLELVRQVGTLDELEAIKTAFSNATYNALHFLGEGEKYDDVLGFYFEERLQEASSDADDRPDANRLAEAAKLAEAAAKSDENAAKPETWDMAQLSEAIKSEGSRSQFRVVEGETELREACNGSLEKWRCFLHPEQRKLAYHDFKGPVRVLGDAGTGKTVVALHRVKYLVEKYRDPKDRVLLTTFTRNLARDLKELLGKICTDEQMKRVDVKNISAWANSFVKKQGYAYNVDRDGSLLKQCWLEAYEQRKTDDYSLNFYQDEYALVLQPQSVASFEKYKRAKRIGRGKALLRKDKEALWPVFEEFLALVAERKIKSYDELYRDAADMMNKQPKDDHVYPYRAIVVDETQDLGLTAYQMLRAAVCKDENDLFFVGDARQRIYGYKSSLSEAGINIRGRGRKLRTNYRTTRETYELASRIMSGVEYDDLDGGADSQTRCDSLTTGEEPEILVCKSFEDELTYTREILESIRKLERGEGRSGSLRNVCIVGRRLQDYQKFMNALSEEYGALEVTQDDSWLDEERPGVRFATIHRVKGLEFDYMIVVEANKDVLPLKSALDQCDRTDPAALDLAQKKERALLYVALTRARKRVYALAAGELSEFFDAARNAAQ